MANTENISIIFTSPRLISIVLLVDLWLKCKWNIPVELRVLIIKRYLYTPITNKTFQPAIKLWCSPSDQREAYLRYGHISRWDTSKVSNMDNAFYSQSSFNTSIYTWDVSNVTSMINIFAYATSFNQPLNKWNVSNVHYMQCMFKGASSFNQPLNRWDVSNVSYMECMFYDAISFEQPLTKWNLSNIQNMTGMFHGAIRYRRDLFTDSWKYLSRFKRQLTIVSADVEDYRPWIKDDDYINNFFLIAIGLLV